MTINLTHRQYELLLQMVYMAQYCSSFVTRPETMTPEQAEMVHLAKKIYTIASQTEGLKHLANDYPDGKMGPASKWRTRTRSSSMTHWIG